MSKVSWLKNCCINTFQSICQLFTSRFRALLIPLAAIFASRAWSSLNRYLQTYRIQRIRNLLQQVPHEYAQLDLRPELQTIRLIELYPGQPDDAVEISLQTTSLIDPDTLDYEAISYCWGSAVDRLPVLCEKRAIWVTENLYDVLRRLRYEDKKRMIWADAVCINQSDDDEKSAQVRVMTNIYKNSERVLIWLGEEADDSKILEDFIPLMLKAKEWKTASGDKRHFFQMGAEQLEQYGLPPLWNPGYLALLRLAGRPWFRRVWIIQELAISRAATVLCGNWSIPWDSFKDAWDFAFVDLALGDILSTFLNPGDIGSLIPLDWTNRQVAQSIEQPLLQLLIRHRYAQATDPRDKIFALCGISVDSGSDGTRIEISYRKPLVSVYTDTAFNIMAKDQNLEVLSLAAHFHGIDDPELPSWVPDWRTWEVPVPLHSESMFGEPFFQFSASKDSRCSPKLRGHNGQLGLNGYVLEPIVIVGHAGKHRALRKYGLLRSRWHLMDALQNLGEWEQICGAHSGKTYFTGESMLDVFWQTLICGGSSTISFEDKQREFAVFDQIYPRLKILTNLPFPYRWAPFKVLYLVTDLFLALPTLIGIYQGKAHDAIFSQKMGTAYGRRMVKTQSGLIGMATGDVKVGDSVTLFEGGKVPLVVREKDQDYILVGDCYLHGIMDGRAWKQDKCTTMWFS